MNTTEMYDRINEGFYVNTTPYVDRNSPDHPAYMKALMEEHGRRNALFKADALNSVGLSDHPKADKAFALAWENGHDSGFNEIYGHLIDLAELLLND